MHDASDYIPAFEETTQAERDEAQTTLDQVSDAADILCAAARAYAEKIAALGLEERRFRAPRNPLTTPEVIEEFVEIVQQQAADFCDTNKMDDLRATAEGDE